MGLSSEWAEGAINPVTPARKPLWSVIIPTRNRRLQLDTCLTSFSRLEYPRERFEIVVVNDGGDIDVTEIIHKHSAFVDVISVRCEHRGPAAARNLGVRHSCGDLIAFTDDDCRVDSKWLRALEWGFKGQERAMTGGKVVNELADNRYSRASQALQDFLYHWYHEQRRGRLPFFTTNNLAIARAEFDRIGGFDEAFTFASEDRDISDRAIAAGLDLVYAPDAIVEHAHDLDLRQFLIQHFRYGEGAALFHAARASRREDRVRLEPAAFYREMIKAPFAAGGGALPALALLIASQSASLLGFAHALARRA